jgi:hypothetical protein
MQKGQVEIKKGYKTAKRHFCQLLLPPSNLFQLGATAKSES